MQRGYLLISILILTSLACGWLSTATPLAPTPGLPTEPTSTQASASASTTKPTSTLPAQAETTAAPPGVDITKTPFPTSVLDAQMQREIDQIQSQVMEARGLRPVFPVPVVLLSPEELRQNVVNDFLADYTDEEIADDMIELSILGLIEPNFDIHGFYTDLLSEQVAGYYDDDVAEMFVVRGEGFDGPEHLTYAHEFTHVLQDQNYDIDDGLNYNDETCDEDTERCAAIQALLEGDATLTELTWFQFHASTEDQQEIIQYIQSMDSPVFERAPAFLKEDFIFAYNQGLEFVQYYFQQGDWSAVDALYTNPPVSTEQILHPSKYPSDSPIPVDLPDLISILGDGWREVSRNQIGEWYTYLILAHGANPATRVGDEISQGAAEGWGGDEYLVLHYEAAGSTVFVVKTIWDTDNDASEFADAFESYADARFEVDGVEQADTTTWAYSGGFSSLYKSGNTTIWIIAPDSTTAQTVSDAVMP